ncbi:uncharacterized protein PG986_002896 [Apiospora aurea]|uniref:Uncharacterized protein n=1 Tax=Apiospora aurea TaxID=335848 RepID=A0ABR1QQ44_9PEZI
MEEGSLQWSLLDVLGAQKGKSPATPEQTATKGGPMRPKPATQAALKKTESRTKLFNGTATSEWIKMCVNSACQRPCSAQSPVRILGINVLPKIHLELLVVSFHLQHGLRVAQGDGNVQRDIAPKPAASHLRVGVHGSLSLPCPARLVDVASALRDWPTSAEEEVARGLAVDKCAQRAVGKALGKPFGEDNCRSLGERMHPIALGRARERRASRAPVSPLMVFAAVGLTWIGNTKTSRRAAKS